MEDEEEDEDELSLVSRFKRKHKENSKSTCKGLEIVEEEGKEKEEKMKFLRKKFL